MKGRGIVSVYLWGFVLTSDFVPTSSDADAVALVTDLVTSVDEREAKARLASGVPNLRINFIYLSELNGSRTRGGLASVVSPRLLLSDFPYWKHIAGQRYVADDFDLDPADEQGAIGLELDVIRKRFLPGFAKGDFSDAEYFGKNVSRMLHYIHAARNGESAFSYGALTQEANSATSEVARTLIDWKKNGWSSHYLQGNWKIFSDFLNRL